MAATLPQGEDKARAVRAMFDAIAPRYDLVNRVMTFGLDIGWRRRAVRALGLAPGAAVLDVACGTGDLCRDLTAAGYRPVGVDLSFGMLGHARAAAPLVQADAADLPLAEGAVDGAVSGFALRNFVSLAPVFAELARVVRPGGRVALLDVATPPRFYFNRVVPRIGGLLSDPAAYRYLPRSVAYLPPPPEIVALLEHAGFGRVTRASLSAGVAQLFVGTRVVTTASERAGA
jgi:demethylmenaquinone methyltransferase/2-methoxy-6-polyprenyl-1,4-benzoquinol methylase